LYSDQGTFDSFWAEINVSMVKSNTNKEFTSTIQSPKLNNNQRSVFQEIAKLKKHMKNIRSVK
tara:strand:- start:740 stop:928 length:189 start_codon:yes stop_codon:yes gene_type:complete